LHPAAVQLKSGAMKALDRPRFETLLNELCNRLTAECRGGATYESSKAFENRVREAIKQLIVEFEINLDRDPHPYGFPDIAIGKFGVEVKFTVDDSWRTVANSVFERHREEGVNHIYLVFGKMGGQAEVRWGRYEDCVIHVRTSHVPRFEVEIGATEPLFHKFGITYDQFSSLPEDERMVYIRKYARSRLEPGEGLWWLEPENSGHALELQVKPFSELNEAEKLKLRSEASLLFPQIVGSSHNRTKYVAPLTFLLSYRGIMATRDAFSAGSAAGPQRGGNYVRKALQKVQQQMIDAAHYLDDALFVQYWGGSVPPNERIREWLRMADEYANVGAKPWRPSEHLFLNLPEAR
jgi:hypothetical protein